MKIMDSCEFGFCTLRDLSGRDDGCLIIVTDQPGRMWCQMYEADSGLQ